jgi:ADP-heptose:LPS heptosyltransferase
MEAAESNKTVRSRLCRVLGEQGRIRLVRAIAPCLRRRHRMALPRDLKAARNVALFLPGDPLEALYAIPAILAFTNYFRDAHRVIICERSTASYFDYMQGIAEIVSYDAEGRFLYSREMTALETVLSSREYDVCVMMERAPDISLLKLMLRISSGIRIGYDNGRRDGFYNFRVRGGAGQGHVSARTLLLAHTIGARPPGSIQWNVSKQSMEEIRHALRENRVDTSVPLAGIDAGYFYRRFGSAWAGRLVASLTQQHRFSWYLYSESAPGEGLLAWCAATNLPLFSSLSPSRTAALIQLSWVVVSGRAVLFALASILSRPVVAVLERSEAAAYSTSSPRCSVVQFSGNPGEETVAAVCGKIPRMTTGVVQGV